MHTATLHARPAYPEEVSDGDRRGPTFEGRVIELGDVFEAEMGSVAHGGHVVARVGEVVAFTRGALPGETARIRVTDIRSRFLRADAIEILHAHPDRRSALCAVAGVCGGCDFQHAPESLQRQLKLEVIRESLIHHGRLSASRVDELLRDGIVDLGLDTGWRSRMHYRVMSDANGGGVVGMYQHRSDALVDASPCVISDPEGQRLSIQSARNLTPGTDIYMASGLGGAVVDSISDSRAVVQHRIVVGESAFDFTVPIDGFWQVHPLLAQAIVDRLVRVAQPRPGQSWWDLYAGAGPLSAGLGASVGSTGRVDAVESSPVAVEAGQQALGSLPWVRWHRSDVRRWLTARAGIMAALDGVVLDPPRSGAGRRVLEAIVGHQPGTIVLVACDPVALGRDTAILADQGYALADVCVWDAFPQTHHMETMAIFLPRGQIS